MFGFKSLLGLILLLGLFTLSNAAVLEVSSPTQVTGDGFYERGQSVLFDGSEYWLFYGRSVSVTGTYETDSPDISDYQIYYKKAASIEELASASPIAIPGAANIFNGEVGSAFYHGEVWVFGSSGGTLYGWYFDGSWNMVTIASGLPAGAEHHKEIVFQDSLWVAYTPSSLGAKWHTVKSNDPKNPLAWSFPLMVNNAALNGQAEFFFEDSELYLAICAVDNLFLCHYEPGPISWTTVDQIYDEGRFDPAILSDGGEYLFVTSKYSADSSYSYLSAYAGNNSNTVLSTGAEVLIDQSSFASNSWSSIHSSGIVNMLGDYYLFYTTERNPVDPSNEIAGNIWYLKIDWSETKSLTSDHFTYIQSAIDSSSYGDRINVSEGIYLNDFTQLNKSVSLYGPQNNVDPYNTSNRGSEAILIRDDGLDYTIVAGADGAEINGFKFGDGNPGAGRAVSISNVNNVAVEYNIFENQTATAIQIGTGSNNANIHYNRIIDADSDGIICQAVDTATISSNHITGIDNGSAIICDGAANLIENTVGDCLNGIIVTYSAADTSRRCSVIGNNISYIENTGINIGGRFNLVSENVLSYCNIGGVDNGDNWNYAMIHVGDSSSNVTIRNNTVFNGINGIQTWSDSTHITGNIIYRMGLDYPQQQYVNGRLYKNSAIILGSNYGHLDHDPFDVLIYSNYIASNNFHYLFHSDEMFMIVNASFNYWGDSAYSNIDSKIDNRVDCSPWLGFSDDIDPLSPGFQGDLSNLWVDDDAGAWSDSLFIAEAIESCAYNSVIHVRAGLYEEDIKLGNYWELETPGSGHTGDAQTILLIGAQAGIDHGGSSEDRPGGESIIKGRVKLNTNGEGAGIIGFKIDATDFTFDRRSIFIQRAPKAHIGYNILLNSKTHAIECGWDTDGASGALIEYNLIDSAGLSGIMVYSEGPGNDSISFIGNTLRNTKWNGIQLSPNGADNFVIGNILENCGTQGVGFYPIRAYNRCVIDSNTVLNSRNGILAAYAGSGADDRIEIKHNYIENIVYPGIVIGDFEETTNFGAHTFAYGNELTKCNHTGHTVNDNWQYGSIMAFENADSAIINNNTISNGIKGITYWSDYIEIKENKIFNLPLDYDDEEYFNGQLYLNSAIQSGSYLFNDEQYNPVGAQIYGNHFSGNRSGLFIPAPNSVIDASCNWWGSANFDSVALATSDSVDYTPWLSLGSDTNPDSVGHQGVFSVLWVDDDSPQNGDDGYIQEAINKVHGSTVYLEDGIYTGTINLDSHDDFILHGRNEGQIVIKPDSLLNWNVGAASDSIRQAAIRVVDCNHVTLSNLVFDFDNIKDSDAYGLLYWNTGGAIFQNRFDNMNGSGNHEYLTCFRAPAYNDAFRAAIEIYDNQFYRTGRVAITGEEFVDLNIHDNIFDKAEPDFGHGIRLSSHSIGAIVSNEFIGYKTWSDLDDYVVGAIIVDNSNTVGAVPLNKMVLIDGNIISDCQFGIIAGNQYAGLAGDVDIDLIITNNNIKDNTVVGSYSSGGIILTDEGADNGSSLMATIDSNMITNVGDYGIYIFGNGNADITANVTNNWLMQNNKGISIKDYGSSMTGDYDLNIYYNMFDNSLNAENDVATGYWDDDDGAGNCWSDYDDNGEYIIMGSAGSIDRYPNINCGNCDPGDANNSASKNILDVTYLIKYLYDNGADPAPYSICSGDPNSDCTVNIIDITYLIQYLYLGGPEPGNTIDWVNSCGGPIRAPEDITDIYSGSSAQAD